MAALIFAMALLLPGGCFLMLGIAGADLGTLMIGLLILALVALLFWVALRTRKPPAGALRRPAARR